MDILYLVDRLENIMANGRKMPLLNQMVFKENDVVTMLNILEQMHNSIPGEFAQAQRVTQERDRILAQAQAEATALREKTQEEAASLRNKAQGEASILRNNAREESDRVLNREGLLRAAEERSQDILRQAKEQAREIMRQAEEHTEHMKADADAYAAETLQNLKEHLASIESEVSRNILSIEKGLESLEAQKYEEIYATDATGEENELDDTDAVAEDQMPAYPLPRRSSLANDTMGGPNFP